ncbi:hypothetical protein DFH06DRAFT_1316663 [Mycena polygramma]|nr:hypothetical protein DFH06DRAFT_1316663 [Mycena polygramma]
MLLSNPRSLPISWNRSSLQATHSIALRQETTPAREIEFVVLELDDAAHLMDIICWSRFPPGSSIFPFTFFAALSMGGKTQKKRKLARKISYKREGKRISLRYIRSTVQANRFFYMPEMLGTEVLQHCDLATLMALAKTGSYGRELVKRFVDGNVSHLVKDFVGKDELKNFFRVLDDALSAVAGSVVTASLTPPYRHNAPDAVLENPATGVLMPRRWKVTRLTVVMPRGYMPNWRGYLDGINLSPAAEQPGVDLRFAHTVVDYVVYNGVSEGFSIGLVESCDESVMTPVIGGTTTFDGNFATSANVYSLYTGLLNQRRALESWFPTPVPKAVAMAQRRFKSSFSTGSWGGPCGWSCPILWRQVRGMAGVGVFQWGGHKNRFKDGSEAGIPYTDNDMKWRLGDTCTNKHCPMYGANYFTSVQAAA